MSKTIFSQQAEALVKTQGKIEYNLAGMSQPKDYSGPKGPYVEETDLTGPMKLAQDKMDYLLSTTKNRGVVADDAFIDLRDGGTDTKGLPGKPIMTGWLDYAEYILKNDAFLDDLKKAGDKIADDFDALVVIGIGGSYTNIEGIINACNPLGTRIPIFYLGQHLSADAYQNVFNQLKKLDGKVAVNVISKSGTTTEPAIALRIVIDFLEANGKLGAVFATTDPQSGALRQTVAERGFNPKEYITEAVEKEFSIGSNIGGRFSVITPVGLLPFAVANIDLREFLLGFHYAMENLQEEAVKITAHKYAAYQNGADTAVLSYNTACFRLKLLGFRQLWPECNGKDGKGLNLMEEFYTSDAHSNGQLIKSGKRNLMEIFHFVDDLGTDFDVPVSQYNLDNLEIVAKGASGAMSLHAINNKFMGALLLDHWNSGVPVIAIKMPKLTPFIVAMGMGLEFYQATLFGLILGINPLNQPGVVGYKNIAFDLLGMNGAEKQAKGFDALSQFNLK